MNFITKPFKELVTKRQYANAKTHWEKLIAGQISKEFNMRLYVTGNPDEQEAIDDKPIINECATAACSAGYLPETLNLKRFPRHPKEEGEFIKRIHYTKLIHQTLGINPEYSESREGDMAFEWCFSGYWHEIDNSAKGAGIRLRILFEQGIPASFKQQQDGSAFLMYQDELDPLPY